jgi:hypothetical protein
MKKACTPFALADGKVGFGWLVVDSVGEVDIQRTISAVGDSEFHRDRDEVRAMVEATIEMGQSLANFGDACDPEFEYGCLFKLARRLKCLAAKDMRGVERGEYFSPYALVFRDVLAFRNKLPESSDQEIDWKDDDQVTAKFEATWGKVEFAEGENVLLNALDFARSDELVLDRFTNRHLRVLVGISYYLQALRGKQTIQLPQERLGEMLGVSPQHVSSLIQMMVNRKLLKPICENFSLAQHKAKTYRFVGIIARRDD